ncbi:MAG TPA: aldose 1-epimerase [Pirellulales bacterium]|jgi:aldose 1-epimerase|nr:aldose 1-epimerase [Pirellulales bacterium]
MHTISLVDPATGSLAKLLPELGFNCFSYVPVLDGEPVELLWSAPGFETSGGRTTRSGIPILFPYAGRLRGTVLRFGGKEFPLTIDERLGFAIHGFVHDRPWRIVAQSPSSVTGEFRAARDDPTLLNLWPADFRIRVCYEVHHVGLSCSLAVDNPGDRPLPFGLGTHGYFRLPLGSFGKRDECHLTVPAQSYWELEGMLPTGRKLPATDGRAVGGGMLFGETQLDDIFTDLQPRSGRVVCRLLDPVNDRRLSLVFDESFGQCVVFNPPHREAICIEPYTCVPDAFALSERGLETGLRILQAGESFQAHLELRPDEI